MANAKPAVNRPLSPHLSIYRMQINMVMSIVHRITGAALYVGTLLLAWWLVAAATGPEYFSYVSRLLASPIGMLVLFGYSWALLHHMLGGIRHLIWDLGYGFGPSEREWLTRAALFGSITLTIVVWIIAYLAGGGR